MGDVAQQKVGSGLAFCENEADGRDVEGASEDARSASALAVVIGAIEDVLQGHSSGPDTVTAATRLDALELDSLQVAELFVRLEELTGALVDAASAERMEVVGDLLGLLPPTVLRSTRDAGPSAR